MFIRTYNGLRSQHTLCSIRQTPTKSKTFTRNNALENASIARLKQSTNFTYPKLHRPRDSVDHLVDLVLKRKLYKLIRPNNPGDRLITFSPYRELLERYRPRDAVDRLDDFVHKDKLLDLRRPYDLVDRGVKIMFPTSTC